MKNNISEIGLYLNQNQTDYIFNLLKHNHNINLGDKCSINIISKYDHMNYYGIDGTHLILDDLLPKFKSKKVLTFIDAGSGYGGTSRLISTYLKKSGYDSKIYAIELQENIHKVAKNLTEMTLEINNNEIIHINGNIIENNINLQNKTDIIISRLCVLHLDCNSKYKFLSNCFKWLNIGGYIAIEDYAEISSGLTRKEKKILNDSVSVPEGELLTIKKWIKLLKIIGFKEIKIIDLTDKWKIFIKNRSLKTELNKSISDKLIGSQRRIFYNEIDQLFSNNNILGIKIYAKK